MVENLKQPRAEFKRGGRVRVGGWTGGLVVTVSEPLGLVEFLADLRQDLALAQEQAATRALAATAAGRESLWLGLEEVTVSLEVTHERKLSGSTSGKIGGKFWVFASAEASVTAGGESKRSGTQTLTLTLKPRVEMTVTDAQGRSVTSSHGVDVEGLLGADEQLPPPLKS
jgi:hypothetical protein